MITRRPSQDLGPVNVRGNLYNNNLMKLSPFFKNNFPEFSCFIFSWSSCLTLGVWPRPPRARLKGAWLDSLLFWRMDPQEVNWRDPQAVCPCAMCSHVGVSLSKTPREDFKINIFYYFARTAHGKVKQYMDIKSIMLTYKDNI